MVSTLEKITEVNKAIKMLTNIFYIKYYKKFQIVFTFLKCFIIIFYQK